MGGRPPTRLFLEQISGRLTQAFDKLSTPETYATDAETNLEMARPGSLASRRMRSKISLSYRQLIPLQP